MSVLDLANLQDYTEQQIKALDIPALSIAVWQDGQLYRAASGISSLASGVAATPDTLFQIGSITKVFTATLVMKLVEAGRLELDRPVKHYLPDFLVADPEATQSITVRQLLNHTSGMMGDYFPDDPEAGNPVARYVDRCALLPQSHPVGSQYSYSNSAYVVAGRLVEVLFGMPWHIAMQRYIFDPLGMRQAIADPKESIYHAAAMGHVLPQGEQQGWQMSQQMWRVGMGPCGLLMMSASDVLTFARAHMNGGINDAGEQWLAPELIDEMRSIHVSMPRRSQCIQGHYGLGWSLQDYRQAQQRVYGHTGATQGFYAVLRVLPEKNLAFVILINASQPSAMPALSNDLLQSLAGFHAKEPPLETGGALTPAQKALAGRYESFDKVITIEAADDHLRAHMVYNIDPLPPTDLSLFPIEPYCFGVLDQAGKRQANLVFVGEGGAEGSDYLFDGSRLNRCTPIGKS